MNGRRLPPKVRQQGKIWPRPAKFARSVQTGLTNKERKRSNGSKVNGDRVLSGGQLGGCGGYYSQASARVLPTKSDVNCRSQSGGEVNSKGEANWMDCRVSTCRRLTGGGGLEST